MDRPVAIRLLGSLRILVGVSIWLAPRAVGRLFGLDPAGNRQLAYAVRLFASRDAALGIGTLRSRGEAQRRWVRNGLGCDVVDTLAGLSAARRGEVSRYSAAALTLAALTGVGLSSLVLLTDRDAA